MRSAFLRCSSLKEIDLSNFNTFSVITMDKLFYGCSSLEEVDLFSFDTSSVTSMKYYFFMNAHH